MLLGDAEKRRLDLRASHAGFRSASHPLDSLVEKGGVAAKRVWKCELLAPIGIARSALACARWRRRHADRQFLAADDLADRQLHRVAEIDRDRQSACPHLQRGRERQEISDAGDDDGDRMNIHAFDTRADFRRAELGVHIRFLRLAQKDADGVEQKCSRPAGGIEHMFDKRPVDYMLDHLRRQPIGRVIFAEPMALVAVDERLVKNLENVALNFGETETPDMVHDAAHEFLALRIGHNPIEKIAFDGAPNPGCPERVA